MLFFYLLHHYGNYNPCKTTHFIFKQSGVIVNMAESFITNQRFFDNRNFPRGFSRQGDFTIKEAQLLERLGHAFDELISGKRQPVTEEEKVFVTVFNEGKIPTTENEKVWAKYLSKITKPKRFHTLSGGKPTIIDSLDDFTDSDE